MSSSVAVSTRVPLCPSQEIGTGDQVSLPGENSEVDSPALGKFNLPTIAATSKISQSRAQGTELGFA